MLESELQAKCIKYAKEQGFIPLKIITSNMPGIQDLILFKNKEAIFCEVKTDSKESELQKYRRQQFTEQGFVCYVVFSFEEFKQNVIYNHSKL